jgi:hypothetical protein
MKQTEVRISVKEYARMKRISVRTVYRRIEKRLIPYDQCSKGSCYEIIIVKKL